MLRSIVPLVLAGCGRYAFDPHGVDDASRDTPSADVGVESCATSTSFLCDDFEGATLDGATWMRNEFDGMVSIDTAPASAHRGAHSLHTAITTMPASGAAQAGALHLAPIPPHVFIRAFVFQPGTPASALYINPFENLAGTGHAIELRNVDGHLQLAEYDSVNNVTNVELATFTSDRWTCLELEVDGIPSSGVATALTKVYIDEVEVPELETSAPMGPLAVLGIGLNEPVLAEVWFDDVLVDTARIGCSR